MTKHNEVFKCAACGEVELIPEEYLRGLIARNREFVVEAIRSGPLPAPRSGALRFDVGPQDDNKPPPIYITRNA